MRGVQPADKARRLVDEAEFEVDSIKELIAHCRALDRAAAPKPPPLPLMLLSPATPNTSPAQARETLAGRLAMLDAS